MSHILSECTYVDVTIDVLLCTMTMPFVLKPISLIVCIGQVSRFLFEFQYTITVVFIVLELTFIRASVWHFMLADSMPLTVEPLAVVVAACGERFLS